MGPKLGIRFDSTNLFFSFTQGSWVTMKKIVICQVTTRNFLNSSCSQTPSRYSHIFFLILLAILHFILFISFSNLTAPPFTYLLCLTCLSSVFTQPDSYEAQLIQEHKAKAGYVPFQCDAEFLSIAKDLKHYGEHLFLTKVSH